MCKKLIIVVLALSFCLISSASATISWDFENGKSCRFDLWSVQGAGAALDDPTIAGDEQKTGVGGPGGLPGAGLAWSVGSPNQYDGLKPAVANGARIGADGLLNYSLGTEDIPAGSGTLNTYNLNQDGDNLHTAANDQIATSTPITLGENAVLTVWAYGGGSGTHAPTYDPDPTLMYTNGSCGIAVLLAEDYSILASVKIGGQGTLQEDTLDLSAFAGQTVFIEIVDAFDGSWGWLAVDEIQISNTDQNPVAGFICQLTEGELAWGFDAAQVDHLISLGYDVDVISHLDLADGTFTKADADEYDVLVISESPNSNGCDSIIGTSAPMMHQEAFGWDNHFFMGVRTNIRWLDGQTQVEVVNDTHPIMVDAGFPVGKLPWFTAPEKYTTEDISMMAPGAELLVKADAEEAAVVFAIEKGAELANGNPAAGRVVCFSISGAQDGPNQINGILDASIMAPEQWALYDAAIRWLNPAPVEIPAMVAHWTMDEGAGTLVADVVGGNNGEMVGNVSWIDGVLGGAITFDNSDPNAAIVIPHSEVLDFGDVDFSISLMVRYPIIPADAEHQLIMKGSFGSPDSGSRYTLFNKNGEFRFEIDNGSADVKSGIKIANAPVVTGEWVHVVLVRDAVNDLLAMYIDGVLMTSGTDNSGDISSGEEMRIGNTTVGNGRTCEADIDDVRIFPSALTEAEIAAIGSL